MRCNSLEEEENCTHRDDVVLVVERRLMHVAYAFEGCPTRMTCPVSFLRLANGNGWVFDYSPELHSKFRVWQQKGESLKQILEKKDESGRRQLWFPPTLMVCTKTLVPSSGSGSGGGESEDTNQLLRNQLALGRGGFAVASSYLSALSELLVELCGNSSGVVDALRDSSSTRSSDDDAWATSADEAACVAATRQRSAALEQGGLFRERETNHVIAIRKGSPVAASRSKSRLAKMPKGSWRWYDDSNDRWSRYNSSTSRLLDKAFLRDKGDVEVDLGRFGVFIINVQRGTQLNPDTGNVRRVMRDGIELRDEEEEEEEEDDDALMLREHDPYLDVLDPSGMMKMMMEEQMMEEQMMDDPEHREALRFARERILMGNAREQDEEAMLGNMVDDEEEDEEEDEEDDDDDDGLTDDARSSETSSGGEEEEEDEEEEEEEEEDEAVQAREDQLARAEERVRNAEMRQRRAEERVLAQQRAVEQSHLQLAEQLRRREAARGEVTREVNEEMVEQLTQMGFSSKAATMALQRTRNRNIHHAMNWLLENPDAGGDDDEEEEKEHAGEEDAGEQAEEQAAVEQDLAASLFDLCSPIQEGGDDASSFESPQQTEAAEAEFITPPPLSLVVARQGGDDGGLQIASSSSTIIASRNNLETATEMLRDTVANLRGVDITSPEVAAAIARAGPIAAQYISGGIRAESSVQHALVASTTTDGSPTFAASFPTTPLRAVCGSVSPHTPEPVPSSVVASDEMIFDEDAVIGEETDDEEKEDVKSLNSKVEVPQWLSDLSDVSAALSALHSEHATELPTGALPEKLVAIADAQAAMDCHSTCERGLLLTGFEPEVVKVDGGAALRHVVGQLLRSKNVRYFRLVPLFNRGLHSILGIAVLTCVDLCANSFAGQQSSVDMLNGMRVVSSGIDDEGGESFAPFTLRVASLRPERTEEEEEESSSQRLALAHQLIEATITGAGDDDAASPLSSASSSSSSSLKWTYTLDCELVKYTDALSEATRMNSLELVASMVDASLSTDVPFGALLHPATSGFSKLAAACAAAGSEGLREVRRRFVLLQRVNAAVLSRQVLPLLATQPIASQCRELFFCSTQWDIARFVLMSSTPGSFRELLRRCSDDDDDESKLATTSSASTSAAATAKKAKTVLPVKCKAASEVVLAEDELGRVWAHVLSVGFAALRQQPSAVVPGNAPSCVEGAAGWSALQNLLSGVATGLLSADAGEGSRSRSSSSSSSRSSAPRRLLLRTPNTQLHGSALGMRDLWIPRPTARSGVDLLHFECIGVLMGCVLRANAFASFAVHQTTTPAVGEDPACCFPLHFPSIVWKTLCADDGAIGRSDLRAIDEPFVSGVLDLLESINHETRRDEEVAVGARGGDSRGGHHPAWQQYLQQLRSASRRTEHDDEEEVAGGEGDGEVRRGDSPRWEATLSDRSIKELVPGGGAIAVNVEVRVEH